MVTQTRRDTLEIGYKRLLANTTIDRVPKSSDIQGTWRPSDSFENTMSREQTGRCAFDLEANKTYELEALLFYQGVASGDYVFLSWFNKTTGERLTGSMGGIVGSGFTDRCPASVKAWIRTTEQCTVELRYTALVGEFTLPAESSTRANAIYCRQLM